MPRKPVRGGDPGLGGGEAGRPGLRRGARASGEGRAGPAAPSPAASRAVASAAGGPAWAVRVPCAAHLRTAPCVTVSAGDSLEGGHSLQPLHTAELRRASQNGGAHGSGGGRSPSPFCARRGICQHGIPPPRMHLTGKPASGNGARGDRVARRRRLPGAPSSSVFSERSLRGRARAARKAAEGRGGPRPAAPGTRGGVTAGQDPEGRGPGGPLSSSVSRPVSLVRARRGAAEASARGTRNRGACSGGPGDRADALGRRVHRRDGDGTILDLLSRRSPTWDCMLLMSLGGHRNVLLPNSCTGQACWAFNFQVQEQNGGMTCWHFTRGRLTLRRQRML